MRLRCVITVGAVLVAAAPIGGGSAYAVVRPHPPAVGPAAASPAQPGTDGRAMTLVTGDVVRLFHQPGGDVAVGVTPGRGRETIAFRRELRRSPRGTEVSLVPSDAAPLLAAGTLDPRLFDVTGLARRGVTDGTPLILGYRRGTAARAVAPAGLAAAARPLASVNGAAVRQDARAPGAFWRWLTGHGIVSSGGAVRKVWLDGLAQPSLDVSVPQIGAPVAWRAGFTGAGVTAGVLDTGIKADHPDLVGKVVEARDFTDTSPEAVDDVGHGTHVASIMAGTGAASGGRYRGVAPDAKLISGKVCYLDGCPESAIIAGMEWIAPKVRVVNMSLGGSGTDGTDPTSQALNALSAKYGTLFVVAAGNAGLADQVAAPASADAALAVGSVTKQDATSVFSSRGPRLGDYAVKPDIAAPGSDIVAARAPGTPGGDHAPVGEHYASASGTSMASPHVAGAAALLAQQHPDWDVTRLKPTLVSTAKPTAGVFDQGAGRVDVARAVTQPVTAVSGSLNYGFFAWPHDQQPVTRTVTYRNDGDAPVDLTLSLTATGPDGKPAPSGLFTPTAAQVTVPAHGTASAGLAARPAAGQIGLYGGRLTATAAGPTPQVVQTALAVYLEPESHTLSVRIVSRTGTPDTGSIAQAVNAQTGETYRFPPLNADRVATLRLPKGRYDVTGFDESDDPSNKDQPWVLTLASRPNVDLSADASVTLDARAGRPVGVTLDDPAQKRVFGEYGVFAADRANTTGGSISYFTRGFYQLFAVPTERAVTDHTYAFFLRSTLATGTPGAEPSAPVHQVAFLERGRIPANTVYRVRDRDLAQVRSEYRTQGAATEGFRADYARLALVGAGSGSFPFYNHTFPSVRTEYYTAGAGVTWLQLLGVSAAGSSDLETQLSVRAYRPGRQLARWNSAPLGPAFGDPTQGWAVVRDGSRLSAAVTLFSGADPAQHILPGDGTTGTTTLSRDGVLLGTSGTPGVGQFPMPDAPGRYTLRTTATRAEPWSVLGTSADVSWTFREPGKAAPVRLLPLLVVRAGGAVDEAGVAPAGRPYRLALTAQGQLGSAPVVLTHLTVEASYDDGATWRAAPTTMTRGGGVATLRHPAAAGFVSLRVRACDRAGNTVTQTVLRAYRIALT